MKDNLNTLRAIFFAVIVTGIVGVLTVIAARIGGGGDPIPAAVNTTTSSSQVTAPAVPDAIPGEQVPIPLGKDLIALDGDLADWAALPVYRVDWGTQPNGTPTANPYYEFSVAADGEYFYFMATMPDDVIVVGENGHNWNGDSVEFSLNLTGDLLAAEYREGIFQVRIDPRHLNNTDPADFGLEGEWLANAEVRAFVFETADGWGVEAAVAWSPYDYVPHNGAVIGFNTSLNGATQPDGGRDVKLIWSLWDTADRAWLDPSVLGIGVFKDDFR